MRVSRSGWVGGWVTEESTDRLVLAHQRTVVSGTLVSRLEVRSVGSVRRRRLRAVRRRLADLQRVC